MDKIYIYFIIVIVILIVIIYKPNSDLNHRELTDKTHDNYVKQGNVLVKYYAPWCHYCNELDPKFKAIGNILKGNIKTASLNADKYNMDFVESFPTLIFYPINGDPIKYDGKRSVENIIEFVKKY